MLKLAMLKRFCLKKKNFLYLAILPLRRSVLSRTVYALRRVRKETRCTTSDVSQGQGSFTSRCRATFFFRSRTPFWWKMNSDISFFFFFPWETRGYNVNSWGRTQLGHPRSQQGGQGRPYLFDPLQPLDSQEESTQLRGKTTVRSTVPRLSLVFLWSAWR